MHSTCGNVSNVYPVVDQSALGCTIFAVRATCALRRLALRRDDTWDWPDYDPTTNPTEIHLYYGYEIVISSAAIDDTGGRTRHWRKTGHALVYDRIDRLTENYSRYVSRRALLAIWRLRNGNLVWSRCSNLDIQLLAIINRIEDYIEIVALSE